MHSMTARPRATLRSLLSYTLLTLAAGPALAQGVPPPGAADGIVPPGIDAILPAGVAYDAAFPKPEAVLGWPLGEWHVRHDQLVRYFEVAEERSDRVQLVEYGRSHEQRPLLLALVSSPENLARAEEIRAAHVASVRGDGDPPGVGVVWMGYGVHGNESSASNASMALLYHLCAARDQATEDFLAKTIVLIDPCINPDGSARFAQWANMHKGRQLVGARVHREHQETWPGGRTNHYWADLNRDWLLLTHRESRGRVEQFQRWLPTVLTDYHEMGSDSTYFFQPGIPTRRNPLTPERNHELTLEIAKVHAAKLDEMRRLYFTEERYDDFYYGKGSSYPDVQGSIGILFEQASARGHLMDTAQGLLSFPFTIQNQFTTSLTTLQAFDALREELTGFQRQFYDDALEEARRSPVGGWLIGDLHGKGNLRPLVDVLLRHGIRVEKSTTKNRDRKKKALEVFFVPAEQPQFRLVRSLFETRTSWDDNTFYDVSSWNFILSFGVAYEELPKDVLGKGKERVPVTQAMLAPERATPVQAGAPGYYADPDALSGPRAMAELLAKGVRVHCTMEPTAMEPGRPEEFDIGAGSLIVPAGRQALSEAELAEALNATGLQWKPLDGGLRLEAPDLGSSSFPMLEEPKVLLAVGSGVSAYEAGEMWHEMDLRIGLPVALIERDRIRSMDLAPYTHVVLVNGATTGWGEREEDALRDWVRGGGVLVATKRSAVWAANAYMSKAEHDRGHDDGDHGDEGPESRPYAEYGDARAAQRIAGTIFQANVDTTHPLGFGMRETAAVFRNFEQTLPEGSDPFATPVRYTDKPLLSGFASPERVASIAGTPAIRAERVGSGAVIAMIDNPVFRGVWYGTRPFLTNALFFGHTIRRTGPIAERTEDEALDYDHGHSHGK